jgi:thymidylate kinase
VVVCDRYVASSVAYGEAQGLDVDWLTQTQRFLPASDLTILLDIAPELAVERKATGRDRYERDLALLSRVRESYLRQVEQAGWVRVDGDRDKADVTAEIMAILGERLSPA